MIKERKWFAESAFPARHLLRVILWQFLFRIQLYFINFSIFAVIPTQLAQITPKSTVSESKPDVSILVFAPNKAAPSCFEDSSRNQLAHFSADQYQPEYFQDSRLLSILSRFYPDSSGLVVMDVGANKGMFSLSLGLIWDDGLQHIVLKSFPQFRSTMGVLKASRLKVHAVEPMPSNAQNLRNVISSIPAASDINVHEVAFSDKEGNATFHFIGKHEQDGDEQGSLASALDNDSSFRKVVVQVTSLDQFLVKLSISRLFFLKIDGEGFDPLILLGGKNTFQSKLVDFGMFEYNDKWRQMDGFNSSQHSLQSMVAFLDEMNYDTFLMGRYNLLQLNPAPLLFQQSYEFFSWSNVYFVGRHIDLETRIAVVKLFNLKFRVSLPMECQRI